MPPNIVAEILTGMVGFIDIGDTTAGGGFIVDLENETLK